VKELPQLERFFAPLADEIRQFALTHNMSIERYYHQALIGGSASLPRKAATRRSTSGG
jgi:hypothetical protein